MSAETPRANGALFSPKVSTMRSARAFAPPECSMSRPSIAPSATRIATEANVEPKPSDIVS